MRYIRGNEQMAWLVLHPAALFVCRKLPQAYTRVQAGNYSLTPLVGSELRGKTVGVLGTGAIGTEAARMFKVRS